MSVTIINIGNELLHGHIVNTNAAAISKKLHQIGHETTEVLVLPDCLNRIGKAINQALASSDILICTGGLGPTHDDVTRDAFAKFWNVELVENSSALEKLRNYYQKRGKVSTSEIEKQAWIPDSSEVILNPVGTAAGFMKFDKGKIVFVIPGVPHEVDALLAQTVIPKVKELLPQQEETRRFFRTVATPETEINRLLDNLSFLPKDSSVSYLPGGGGVDIDVYLPAKISAEEITKVENTIREKLKKCLYAESESNIETVIGQKLLEKQLTIATAESCSGGFLAHRLTNVSGSSNYFRGGFNTYSNFSKIHFLKVSSAIIDRFGAVSEECAKAMAEGARQEMGTDFGLATTGIAGPTGGTPLKPVGTVYVGYSDKTTTFARKFIFPTARETHKIYSSQMALSILWKNLQKLEKKS